MTHLTNSALLVAIALSWSMVAIPDIEAIKLINLIPQYCSSSLEYSVPRTKAIELKSTGNASYINVGASILQGVNITSNYKCFLLLQSPKGTGLILTVRKASLNDNDTITFRSGTNNLGRVWKKNNLGEDESLPGEIATVASRDHESTITVLYEPTVGKWDFNGGFDLAVTVFKGKGDSCGSDFDCLNDRCIDASLSCNGYDNCGNQQDEAGCSGVSWWIVAVLIVVAIVVVALAVLVWVRMSKA